MKTGIPKARLRGENRKPTLWPVSGGTSFGGERAILVGGGSFKGPTPVLRERRPESLKEI